MDRPPATRPSPGPEVAAAPGSGTRRRPWGRLALAAVLLAILGTALFGALHALVIVPIWRRLPGGLPFAGLLAVVLTWTWGELRRAGLLASSLPHALAFGGLLWLAVLPTTLLGTVSRLTGLHRRAESLEMAGALLVAALTGLGLARLFRSPLGLQLTSAALAVTLVLGMAGPVPVVNGPRPRLLLVGFLPLFVAAALGLLALDRALGLTAPSSPSEGA
jgi:hypothetical protein